MDKYISARDKIFLCPRIIKDKSMDKKSVDSCVFGAYSCLILDKSLPDKMLDCRHIQDNWRG